MRQPAHPAALAALLAAGLSAATAHAASARCDVRVVPPGHPVWDQAARDASTQLAEHPAVGDCATVVVEVRESGARLVFTTRDGRRAVRKLAGPDELGPTLEALRVTGHVEAPHSPESPAVAPAAPAAPLVAGDRTPEPHKPAASPPEEHSAVHFGASVGARLGTHALVSPVFDAFGSLSLEHWEIGVLGQWESGYHELGDEVAAGKRASGLAAGIAVGRREPLGSALSLLGGASLGMAALDEETAEHNPTQGVAEGRVGAYVGAVVPRRGFTHLRARLVGEIVPNHVGRTPENTAGEPLMPWWATTFTVGLELGRP